MSVEFNKDIVAKIVQDVLEGYHGEAFENMEDDGKTLMRNVVLPIAEKVMVQYVAQRWDFGKRFK